MTGVRDERVPRNDFANQRAFPMWLRGYDRRAVDEELRRADEELAEAAEECRAHVERARSLDEVLEQERARLAEYRSLHAGEALRHAEDRATGDVVRWARREARTIVNDAREFARRHVARAERAAEEDLKSVEDNELAGRRQLAELAVRTGDVVRSARANCARLVQDFAARQEVFDSGQRELPDLPSFRGTVGIPGSRKSEEACLEEVPAWPR